MFYRKLFSFVLFLALFVNFAGIGFSAETTPEITEPKSYSFILKEEPVIRIGLATNVFSATITTTDSQLVSTSPDEPQKFLATTRVTVSARSYRPPEIENYYFEIPNIATQAEADTLAKEVREATGDTAIFLPGAKINTWRVRIGDKFESIEEANEYKALLSDKGFDAAEMVTEKIVQPSADAVALSNQLKTGAKSEVRSLIKPTVSAIPTDSMIPPTANLREVIVSGTNAAAKFSSLKSVAFGSVSERAVPVRFNSKPYRGKIEVFVNSRGSLTIVNAVSLEDYLLGVVPNELSLPALEAQKAQAVAARTYAVANIGQFGSQGFDLLPTVRSQVYRGFSTETAIGTQAVRETRGMVATYRGKPINALYTSTCGGRTENSENIFDFNEPYLRGVECSLEGRKHFEPFLIKSSRETPNIEDEDKLELVRIAARFAVSGFVITANRFSDEYFNTPPNDTELRSWTNQLALKFGKPAPLFSNTWVKGQDFANLLATLIYSPAEADTLMSESDINYHLSFEDGKDIDKDKRANLAMLFRDGWLSLYPDSNFHPHRPMSRNRLLRLMQNIYSKKKVLSVMQTGVAKSSVDGKLILKSGKSERQLIVSPNVYLFRQFGDKFYQVKETALVGGEEVSFQTLPTGEVIYLEVKPTEDTTTAERMSPLSLWNETLSPSAVQSRLARYVRGLSGSLIDVKIAKQGYSRRATDLEIITTNGTYHLTGGKIRSALRFKEQLFVLNKKYDASGRAISYNFTGRGWGHGVGMCQYGAYGLAKMGVKYNEIVKHYYTGVDLTKVY